MRCNVEPSGAGLQGFVWNIVFNGHSFFTTDQSEPCGKGSQSLAGKSLITGKNPITGKISKSTSNFHARSVVKDL